MNMVPMYLVINHPIIFRQLALRFRQVFFESLFEWVRKSISWQRCRIQMVTAALGLVSASLSKRFVPMGSLFHCSCAKFGSLSQMLEISSVSRNGHDWPIGLSQLIVIWSPLTRRIRLWILKRLLTLLPSRTQIGQFLDVRDTFFDFVQFSLLKGEQLWVAWWFLLRRQMRTLLLSPFVGESWFEMSYATILTSLELPTSNLLHGLDLIDDGFIFSSWFFKRLQILFGLYGVDPGMDMV